MFRARVREPWWDKIVCASEQLPVVTISIGNKMPGYPCDSVADAQQSQADFQKYRILKNICAQEWCRRNNKDSNSTRYSK